MKIVIDETIPPLTEEEKDAIESGDLRSVNEEPEEFRKAIQGMNTVVLSPEVVEQITKMGLTPDDVVAMLLKSAKLDN